MEIQRQEDRVTISLGRKINIGNYESQDVFMSYSSDVNSEESLDECIKRVSAVVETILNEKVKEIAKDTRSRK